MLLQQKVISYMCPPYNILWYNVKICYYKKKLYNICVLNITYYDIMLKYVITTKSDIIYVFSI